MGTARTPAVLDGDPAGDERGCAGEKHHRGLEPREVESLGDLFDEGFEFGIPSSRAFSNSHDDAERLRRRTVSKLIETGLSSVATEVEGGSRHA